MKRYISIIIIILSTNLYSQCQEDLNGDGIANVIDIVSMVSFILSGEECDEQPNFDDLLQSIQGDWNYYEQNYNDNDELMESNGPTLFSFGDNGVLTAFNQFSTYEFSFDNPWIEYSCEYSLTWDNLDTDNSYPYLIRYPSCYDENLINCYGSLYVYKILSFEDNEIQLYHDKDNGEVCFSDNSNCGGYRIITLTKVN